MNYATATMTFVRRWAAMAFAVATLASGCFYPPTQKPPAPGKEQLTLGEPYDLVWDAVHDVIRKNKLRVNADDPNQGIVETETDHFTLADADCGKVKGVSTRYAAEPDRAATAVYYFKVKPKGHAASIVSVQATFSAPLYIPLHPPRDVQCVSRGKAEARLLKQIAQAAASIHRPAFVKPES
jgi:uncharacterized lipoprotein